MKLQYKFLLALLPIVVLPMAVVGITVADKFQMHVTERNFRNAHVLLHHLSQYAENKILSATDNIDVLASLPSVKRYAVTESDKKRYAVMQPLLLDSFSGYQDIHKDYYEIRFINPEGYEEARYVAGDDKNLTDNESDSPFLKDAMSGFTEKYTYIGRNEDNGEVALYVVKPLFLRNPNFEPLGTSPRLRGYLVLTASLAFLQQQVETASMQPEGELCYLNSRGEILFHPRGERVGKRVPESLFQKIQSEIGVGFDHDVEILHGDMYMIGHRAHDELFVVGALDKRLIEREKSEVAWLIAVATMIITLLISLLLYYVLKYTVLNRLARIEDLAHAVGDGEFDFDLDVSGGDEISRLASTFVEMGNSIAESSREIEHIAYHDTLTGLPNRRMFYKTLNAVIERSRRAKAQAAILFLDLDDFKIINDTLGHEMGDKLLSDVTERLSDCVRGEDYLISASDAGIHSRMVARLGGDEFIMILSDINGSDEVTAVAQRILRALESPVALGESEHTISCSIGISIYPQHGDGSEELVKHADIAMYHAKSAGKNSYQVFTEEMMAKLRERIDTEYFMKKALAGNEFSVLFQPQICAASSQLCGIEALLRWHSPELGLVSPEEFIPIAEDIGVIAPLTRWLLHAVCSQNRQWHEQGRGYLHVAVNLSSVHLSSGGVAQMVSEVLQETDMPAKYLELELTETSLISERDRVSRELQRLHNMGISIALDDFGTGFSSLSHLLDFPINKIKIDKSFALSLDAAARSEAIVRATVAMAHSLSIRVVAEGVETLEHAELLRRCGCDVLQGYLFSRPVMADMLFSGPLSEANVVELTLLEYEEGTRHTQRQR